MRLFMGASLVTIVEFMVYIFIKLRSFAVQQRLATFGEETHSQETRGNSHITAYDNSVYL